MKEKYPEPQWTRIFTDGSQIGEVAGAGVYSELFFQYAPVRKFMTNFDTEIYAIHLAITRHDKWWPVTRRNSATAFFLAQSKRFEIVFIKAFGNFSPKALHLGCS
ncbi:hypothetical protein CEXT_577381 [Caerostris extrusa]|uniref:RNase H type-1 domain-containing protein n=1 Tax=Caerostris extrusa TaxID=172846 RepID=A0AAV4RIM7_CAEEX|nr:hypothetical protein CEXT_577381 [Caerostris extrusa]